MTWTDGMSHGYKKQVTDQLRELIQALPEEAVKNGQLQICSAYQKTIMQVRIFLEWTKIRYKVPRNLWKQLMELCNWSHHHADDTRFGHTELTDQDQQALVAGLWDLVRECGLTTKDASSGRAPARLVTAASKLKTVRAVDALCAALAGTELGPPGRPRCRFWVQGQCRYGDACRNAHPAR